MIAISLPILNILPAGREGGVMLSGIAVKRVERRTGIPSPHGYQTMILIHFSPLQKSIISNGEYQVSFWSWHLYPGVDTQKCLLKTPLTNESIKDFEWYCGFPFETRSKQECVIYLTINVTPQMEWMIVKKLHCSGSDIIIHKCQLTDCNGNLQQF